MTTLAFVSTYPSISEMTAFSLTGFGVVMFVLLFLAIVTAIFGKIFIAYDAAQKAKEQKVSAPAAVASAPAKPTIPQDHEFVISAAVAAMMPELKDDQGQLLAVISAAVAATIEDEHRIISFKSAQPDMSWSRQGRQAIYSSKNYIPTR